MTKREYAVSLGLATMGRGRLSREAHAAIAKAESEGMTFSDAVKVAPTPKAHTPKAVTVKAEKSEDDGPVVVTAQFTGEVKTRYTDDTVFVGTDSTGKRREVNARQSCYHCRYSLTSHRCNAPRVLIGSPLEWIDVQPKEV